MRSRCTPRRSRADSVNGPRFPRQRRAPLPLREAVLCLNLWRDCGLNHVFNIAAAVPARRSSRTYSSFSVGESPHRGTAFYASNGPANRLYPSFPAHPPAAHGVELGGWLLLQRPHLPLPPSKSVVGLLLTSFLLKPPLPLHTEPSFSANLSQVVS